MAEARRRLRPGQDAFDLEGLGSGEAEGLIERPGVMTGKRSALLWRVLSSVYDRLGFDVLGDDAFKQLVLARIIEPTSKADSLTSREKILASFASCPISEVACLGRTLEQPGSEFFGHFDTNGASKRGAEAVIGFIELQRRVARGYHTRDTYRLRKLIMAGTPRSPVKSPLGSSPMSVG